MATKPKNRKLPKHLPKRLGGKGRPRHVPKRLHRKQYKPVNKRSYIEKLLYADLKDRTITRAEYNKRLRRMNE